MVSISQLAYPKNTMVVVQVGDTKYLGNIHRSAHLASAGLWYLDTSGLCLSKAAKIPSPDHFGAISWLSYQSNGSHWYLMHKFVMINYLINDPINRFINSFWRRIHYLVKLTHTKHSAMTFVLCLASGYCFPSLSAKPSLLCHFWLDTVPCLSSFPKVTVSATCQTRAFCVTICQTQTPWPIIQNLKTNLSNFCKFIRRLSFGLYPVFQSCGGAAIGSSSCNM